jgi:hypothetical protein
VGALWGWLPCGLVYAQLSVAAASGGPIHGALLMAAFGGGTIVSLSMLGAVLQALGLARLPRRASGALLVLFGAWMLLPLAGSHAPHAAAGTIGDPAHAQTAAPPTTIPAHAPGHTVAPAPIPAPGAPGHTAPPAPIPAHAHEHATAAQQSGHAAERP